MSEDVVRIHQLVLDRQGLLRTPADAVRAGMSTFFDFGAASAIQTIFVVATVAPAPATAGSVSRVRITGLSLYNGNGAANLVLPYDGGAAAANRIYTQLTVAATSNLFIGPAQLPPGGIPITTDFRLDPSQNNLELTVFYTAEYDLTSMA